MYFAGIGNRTKQRRNVRGGGINGKRENESKKSYEEVGQKMKVERKSEGNMSTNIKNKSKEGEPNKQKNDWNNIRHVYRMMTEKYEEIDKEGLWYDEQKMAEQQALMQSYARRNDELLNKMKDDVEEKIKRKEEIEKVDYSKVEMAKSMLQTKGMGWNKFKNINEMVLELQIASILEQEKHSKRYLVELLGVFEKQAEKVAEQEVNYGKENHEEQNEDEEMWDEQRETEKRELKKNTILKIANDIREKQDEWNDITKVKEVINILDKVMIEEDDDASTKKLKEIKTSFETQETCLNIYSESYGKKDDMHSQIEKEIQENKDKIVETDESDSLGNSTRYDIQSQGRSTTSNYTQGKRGQDNELPVPFVTAKKLRASYTPVNERNKNEQGEKKSKQKQMARLRFQFVIKDEKQVGKDMGEQVKHMLYNMMERLKRFEKTIQLQPWRSKANMANLNGDEIKLLSTEHIMHYVDLKATSPKLIKDRRYRMNGICFKSTYSAEEISRIWEELKYKCGKEDIFIQNISMKPSEMQQSEESYAIGYMMGTTEKGIYSTLNEKISEVTEVPTEVSWQVVDQKGVTGKIWEQAKEKVTQRFPNPYSKEHKRMKFGFAPSALVVYVDKEEHIIEAQKKLYDEYGKIIDGNWATAPDGSKMRFVPIMNGSVSREAVVQYLHQCMYTQSISKAGEIVFDLPMKDLFEPKEYLHGLTMEQILHTVTKNEQDNIPVFKHITRKWTVDPLDERYEIVCQPMMKEAAQEFLRKLQDNLDKTFGSEACNHLTAPISTISIQKRSSNLNNRANPELEAMILNNQNDKYGDLLIEGLEKVKENKIKPTKTNLSDDMMSNTSSVSNSTKDSKSIKFSKSTEEEGNELTVERCREEMRRHVVYRNKGWKRSFKGRI